jgi:hypothetical protein
VLMSYVVYIISTLMIKMERVDLKHKRMMVVILVSTLFVQSGFAGENSHTHHTAIAGGVAWHDSKTSSYVGIDYIYRFKNNWGLGVFYEEVSGDFDVQAWGVSAGRFFDNGFKIGGGIGAEHKIKKNKTLGLVHLTTGYDWHRGNWTYGPIATLDFIEGGEQTYYLGFSLGYGW